MTRTGTVPAPPSKSFSHRKLIAASLAGGISRLSRVLESDDTFRTMEVLRSVGAGIERTAAGEYAVTGLGGPPQGGRRTPVGCFINESGTSCRLLTAILATGDGLFAVDGGKRLRQRPMAELVETLAALGSNIAYEAEQGFLPLTITARGLAQLGEESWLPVRADVSSQFLSGLLLAAPLARGGLRILLAGEKTVSWPYVSLTLQTLEDSGCRFDLSVLDDKTWVETGWRAMRAAHPGATRYRVHPGGYNPLTGDAAVVEGDYSGASYLLAAGAAGPSPVTVTGLRRDSLQGDRAILDILEDMGAPVSWNGTGVTVSPGPLRGIDRDMGECPDIVLTVAALACLAQGPTTIRGVPHLRDKESDRLQAPALELAKTGALVTFTDDYLHIVPPTERPAGSYAFRVYNDHRMAMSLALLERAGARVSLDDPACVAKSFPGFWDAWRVVHPETRIAG